MKRIIKRFKSFNSKGSSLIIVLLIALIITAGIFFTNGLFTDTNKPPSDLTEYKPLPTILNDNRVVLQLKTINFESCGDTASLGFLVDQSGSMRYGEKETKLKAALNVFASKFPPGGITGLRTYSDDTYSPIIVPYNYFKNNKTNFANAIRNMTPYKATHSKDAFVQEKADLDAASIKYPDYKFNLIFISDGIPESQAGLDRLCPGPDHLLINGDPRYCGPYPDNSSQCRCFDPEQDPTDVAAQIKASDPDINIFTIGYIHDITDATFQIKLRNLMRNVASKPEYFYEVPSTNDITGILQQIITKVCKAQP